MTDHVDCGLKLFVPRSFFFTFEYNMAHRKVDTYFSCKVLVPRLKERREAEQNSDGGDDTVNNRTSKDQAVVSLKKDRVFQNAWLSKQKPKNFFPSQSQIVNNFDPLKFLDRTLFFRQEGHGIPQGKNLVRTLHPFRQLVYLEDFTQNEQFAKKQSIERYCNFRSIFQPKTLFSDVHTPASQKGACVFHNPPNDF